MQKIADFELKYEIRKAQICLDSGGFVLLISHQGSGLDHLGDIQGYTLW